MEIPERTYIFYYAFSLCIALAIMAAVWALGGVIAYKSIGAYRVAFASVIVIMLLIKARVISTGVRLEHGGVFYVHMVSVAVFVPAALLASTSLVDTFPHLLFELVTKSGIVLLATGALLFIRGLF